MRAAFFTVLLMAILLVAAYFLGRSNGSSTTTTHIVQNIEMVKEIAEMSSLEVDGTQKIVLSNVDNSDSYFSKMKNFFVENTLEVVVPYKAKYGINLHDTLYNVKLVSKDSVHVTLPSCQLLSVQLELDQLTTLNQTGLFASASIEDLKRAEAQLYEKLNSNLKTDTSLIHKAQNNITAMLQKYYKTVNIQSSFQFR